MLEKAINKLIQLGMEKDPLVKTDNGLFTSQSLSRVEKKVIEGLELSTLSGLVDYITTNIDKHEGDLLIQVCSPSEVKLLTPLNDRSRDTLIIAKAMLPSNIAYSEYLATEEFNIMLQSSFEDSKDKAEILKITGSIKEENVRETGDDGTSQSVRVKTGITTIGEKTIPNPVTLKPFRTFPEIEEVESKFIFRMKDGPRAAIFEADGGAWKKEATKNIHEYLEKQLSKIKNIEIIS